MRQFSDTKELSDILMGPRNQYENMLHVECDTFAVF